MRSFSRFSFIITMSSWPPASPFGPSPASGPSPLSPSRSAISSLMCWPLPIMSSIRWKVFTRPGTRSGAPAASFESSAGKCRSQNFETSCPPCPSNTANSAVAAASPGSPVSVRCASSIDRRHPCAAAVPGQLLVHLPSGGRASARRQEPARAR